jgi:WHEP-TRS domain
LSDGSGLWMQTVVVSKKSVGGPTKFIYSILVLKDEVTAQVATLLALKKQYKELTGEDFAPAPAAAAATAQKPKEERVSAEVFSLSSTLLFW